MTCLQCDCSYRHADSVRRFNGGRDVVLNNPPAWSAPSMEAATAEASAAARGSFTVGGYSSRTTPEAAPGAKLTCAVH